MKHRGKTGISLLAIILAAYALNWIFTPMIVGDRLELYFRPKFQTPFQSELWLTSRSTTVNRQGIGKFGKCYEMVDELIASNKLIGKSELEINRLLGTPDTAENKESFRRLLYILADQSQYPSRSVLFPRVFWNTDQWVLQIVIERGRVSRAFIFFT